MYWEIGGYHLNLLHRGGGGGVKNGPFWRYVIIMWMAPKAYLVVSSEFYESVIKLLECHT